MVELLHIASGLRKESSGSVLCTLCLLFIVYLTLVNKWFTKIKVSHLILVSSLSISPAPRLVTHAIILSLSRRGLAVAGLRDYGEQSTYFAGLTVWVDDTVGQVTVQLDPNSQTDVNWDLIHRFLSSVHFSLHTLQGISGEVHFTWQTSFVVPCNVIKTH